jgi:hypothetical protein
MNAPAIDLSLDAVLQPDGLQVRARYRADRFSSQRITSLLDQYRQLLTQVAQYPDEPSANYAVDVALFAKPQQQPAAPSPPKIAQQNGRLAYTPALYLLCRG